MDTNDLIKFYTVDHLTLQQIADKYNVTRQAIHKRLKKAGIEREQGTYVGVTCGNCGQGLRRARFRWHATVNHFCGSKCYFKSLENSGYKPWRQGQRIGRDVVSDYFSLDRGYVVHHVDGNSRNNDIKNLWVFRNHADHMSYHRAGRGRPIFIGGNYPLNQ
jgi:hypothetical protein